MASGARGLDLLRRTCVKGQSIYSKACVDCLRPLIWALVVNVSRRCHLVEITGIAADLCHLQGECLFIHCLL